MRKSETEKETLMKEMTAPEYIPESREVLPIGKGGGLESSTNRLSILKARLREMEEFGKKYILIGQTYSPNMSLLHELVGIHVLPRKTYPQGDTGVVGEAPSKEVWEKIYKPLYQQRKEKLKREIQEAEKNLSIERRNLKKVI